MEGPEWDAQTNIIMQPGSGAEETAIIGGGGEGGHHQGFQRLWEPPGDGDLLIYLGRVILAADDDWPTVVRKFSRERAIWRRMMRILSREGAAP